MRDWRVWALVVTVQGPGARAIVRYSPSPSVVLPLALAISFLFYAACLHGPLIAWVRWLGSRLAVVVLVLGGAAALNMVLYPRADALKAAGRGSDEDDAVITLGRRLVRGERPLYVPTYLGNAPSVGPMWALLVSPVTLTGAYALLTPLSAGVLVWTVRRFRGGEAGTALALLPIGSVGFWELSVTGSDLFAAGVLFVVLTALAWRWHAPGRAAAAALGFLACAAASTRTPFAWVTANLALFMRRSHRTRADLVAAVTVATLAVEGWLWWPALDRTPLYLVSKLLGLLGFARAIAAAAAAVASAAWAYTQARDDVESWWRALWILLVAPLAAVSVGVLSALGWNVAAWQAAGYTEVAVPALVACVAVGAARREAVAP